MILREYAKAFLILIIALAAIIFFAVKGNDTEIIFTWMIFAYFCVVTFLFHYGIVATTKSRPQVFIRYYIGATTIKLFLHLGIIVVYSVFHRENSVRFIMTFMIMYLVFTAFEVVSVWSRR